MSRSSDEKKRLLHALENLRRVADSVEIAIGLNVPLGAELAQTVETSACNLSRGIVKHDAFLLAEQDLAEERQRVAILEEQATPDAFLR
jgi:hypothetical protein